jgi:ABC-type branched-subunit amino acid transport system permease subunit
MGGGRHDNQTAAIVAVPTAFFTFRLYGPYFAIGTWVIAEVARLLFAQWKALGGGTGTSLPRDATREMIGIDLLMKSAKAGDALTYWLALLKQRISPDAAFSVVDWTAYVIFIVVIGGIGTVEGPIVGVIVFFLLQNLLAGYGSWYLLILGLVAIGTMLFAPRGLWGLFSDRTGIQLFPVRRILRGGPLDHKKIGALNG